jgi:hypothetical protein
VHWQFFPVHEIRAVILSERSESKDLRLHFGICALCPIHCALFAQWVGMHKGLSSELRITN